MKNAVIRTLSFAVYPHLSETKKLAIQAATFDGLATILTMFFYSFYTLNKQEYSISLCFIPGILLMTFGLWLLKQQHYTLARVILHMTAVVQVFVVADAAGGNAGYEFYYFTSIIIPFVTFTGEERVTGLLMTALSSVMLIFQEVIGTGLFFEPLDVTSGDKIVSLVVVVIFMVAFLSVARWQIEAAMRHIKEQQGELIHASNLKALGEMAGGIAHEINNPLQTLSLQAKSLQTLLYEVPHLPTHVFEQIEKFESTLFRIAKIIKGLRDLTRDVSSDPTGYFIMKEVLEDVLSISSERLKNLGIQLKISGDQDLAATGHMVQVSQVLINLLNNSVDALALSSEKWISIDLQEMDGRVIISVTDSGPPIPKHVVSKIMIPFFTTKTAGKGTGLGLSISKSIIEKNSGKFYFDAKSPHTRFIIELPGISET